MANNLEIVEDGDSVTLTNDPEWIEAALAEDDYAEPDPREGRA